MKIKKTNEIRDYLNYLNDINDLNMSLGDIFLSLINNPEITSKNEIDNLYHKFKTPIEDIMLDKVMDYLDIDIEAEDNQEIYDRYIKGHIVLCDDKEYLSNPYYQNITLKNVKEGRYALLNDIYEPYEIFALDDIKVDDNYVEHSSLGYFKDKFSFIALNEKDVTWMSITPNEINTMKEGIVKAHGNVLVFGLGLGYYAYMVSLKEEVKSITIIEKDKTIIDFFKKYIYPQFSYKEKITIIESDALKYAVSDGKFDVLFIDLWKTPEDGIDFFLTFKKKELDYKKTAFIYWLNDSFYAFIRRAFISLLLEQFDGLKDDAYQKEANSFDRLINRLYFKTKNLEINSSRDIESLLDNNSLLNLIL